MSISKSPNLRFSEFDSDWKRFKIEDTFSILNGYAFSSSDSVENGCRWIKIADVGINSMSYENPSFLPEEYKQNYAKYLLKEGDYVIALTRPILNGRLKISQIPSDLDGSLLNQRVGKIQSDNDENFIYYLLQGNHLINVIENHIAGTDPPNLSSKAIAPIKVSIPTRDEQQKIADFLSSVDQKIQQLRRKKELLEEYKKGVMQKLFSQEIRFKDENGDDFPDWEVKNVDKFLKLFVTNSFSRNDLTYESGEVKNIHYGDIHSEFKMGFKVNEETVPYIVEEKKLSKYDEDQYVKPGDLIVADASEDYADIGKAIEVLETGEEKILAGLHTIHARDKKPFTVVGFKGYLFRSEAVRKQLKKVSQGASVLGISKSNFEEINVKLPCLAEQQKIVAFLQNIDKNITLVESKIEKFQIFKKGLLQQMFV